jgi:hypothetical protein
MLDVLTNTVGILILVTLLVLLMERGVIVESWIPVQREARVEEAVLLMVDGEGAWLMRYPDELATAAEAIVNAVNAGRNSVSLRGRTAVSEYLIYPSIGEVVTTVTRHEGARALGNSQQQTVAGFEGSALASELRLHAPPERYRLSAFVRDSGAEHYRVLREDLFEQGYAEISWTPIGDQESITLGSSGFEAKPQ